MEIFSGRPFQFVHSIISACLQAASSVSGAMGIAPYDLNLHRRETPGLRTNKGIHIFFLLFLPAIYFAASSSCDLLQCISGCLHPLDNLIKCMFSSFRNYVIRDIFFLFTRYCKPPRVPFIPAHYSMQWLCDATNFDAALSWTLVDLAIPPFIDMYSINLVE